MMLPVEISVAAEVDLAGIWSYIANDNRQAANRILDFIETRIQSLGQFPRIGAACPEIAENMRCRWAGNYGIYYRVSPTKVEIVRILHGSRDIPSAFRQ